MVLTNHPCSTNPSCRLTERVQQLATDGEQLRRENERLCRVIDSGDWGRQRVEELLRAGRVLQEERDALARLAGSLQPQQPQPSSGKQYDASSRRGSRVTRPHQAASQGDGAAQSASAAQQTAAGGLPGRGVGPQAGASAAARNRLMVRTGSSFTAMVRALKQDLLASGALERCPGALLEVDKVRSSRWREGPGGKLSTVHGGEKGRRSSS